MSEPNVFPSPHPLVAHKLTRLRDTNTDSRTCRERWRALSALMTYDATLDLNTSHNHADTPLDGF